MNTSNPRVGVRSSPDLRWMWPAHRWTVGSARQATEGCVGSMESFVPWSLLAVGFVVQRKKKARCWFSGIDSRMFDLKLDQQVSDVKHHLHRPFQRPLEGTLRRQVKNNFLKQFLDGCKATNAICNGPFSHSTGHPVCEKRCLCKKGTPKETAGFMMKMRVMSRATQVPESIPEIH